MCNHHVTGRSRAAAAVRYCHGELPSNGYKAPCSGWALWLFIGSRPLIARHVVMGELGCLGLCRALEDLTMTSGGEGGGESMLGGALPACASRALKPQRLCQSARIRPVGWMT